MEILKDILFSIVIIVLFGLGVGLTIKNHIEEWKRINKMPTDEPDEKK